MSPPDQPLTSSEDPTPAADGSSQDKQSSDERRGKNDFVIRDGFPALRDAVDGHPLIDGKDPLPLFPFASYYNVLTLTSDQEEAFLRDCRKVFSARAREDSAAYSAGVTYFCPCEMKPRCALEALALHIFQTHVKGLDGMFNPEQSGAEWWTLVLDANKNATGKATHDESSAHPSDTDDDEEDEDEVGIHFDADYGLEAQAPNLLLHPRVATITYLSNVGAPTLVFDKTSPPPSDIDKQSLNGKIDKAWLSGPKFGKHVAFDGRLLHGAPALFFPGNDGDASIKEPTPKRPRLEHTPEPEQRVTFLVNIWLNHCPLDAELLDDDILESLEVRRGGSSSSATTTGKKAGEGESSTPPQPPPPFEWKLSDPSKADTVTSPVVEIQPCAADPAGSDEVVICNRLVTIEYGAHMEDLHNASKQTAEGKSVELEFKAGCVSLSVGEEVESEDEDDENAQQAEDQA